MIATVPLGADGAASCSAGSQRQSRRLHALCADASNRRQAPRRQYVARRPDRSKTAPVLNEHSSEASQASIAAALPTSRNRAIGIFDSMKSMWAGVIRSKMAVYAAAGDTALTSTPFVASSLPSDLVSAITHQLNQQHRENDAQEHQPPRRAPPLRQTLKPALRPAPRGMPQEQGRRQHQHQHDVGHRRQYEDQEVCAGEQVALVQHLQVGYHSQRRQMETQLLVPSRDGFLRRLCGGRSDSLGDRSS